MNDAALHPPTKPSLACRPGEIVEPPLPREVVTEERIDVRFDKRHGGRPRRGNRGVEPELERVEPLAVAVFAQRIFDGLFLSGEPVPGILRSDAASTALTKPVSIEPRSASPMSSMWTRAHDCA